MGECTNERDKWRSEREKKWKRKKNLVHTIKRK